MRTRRKSNIAASASLARPGAPSPSAQNKTEDILYRCCCSFRSVIHFSASELTSQRVRPKLHPRVLQRPRSRKFVFLNPDRKHPSNTKTRGTFVVQGAPSTGHDLVAVHADVNAAPAGRKHAACQLAFRLWAYPAGLLFCASRGLSQCKHTCDRGSQSQLEPRRSCRKCKMIAPAVLERDSWNTPRSPQPLRKGVYRLRHLPSTNHLPLKQTAEQERKASEERLREELREQASRSARELDKALAASLREREAAVAAAVSAKTLQFKATKAVGDKATATLVARLEVCLLCAVGW